jgi:hypothetical protein
VLLAALHANISPVVTISPLDSFCSVVNVFSPSIDALIDGCSRGLQFLLASGILVGLYAKYLQKFKHYFCAALLLSLLMPSTERYWQDYVIGVISDLSSFLFLWLFMAKFARHNLLAYFLAGVVSIIAGTIRVLSMHGANVFTQDIAILALNLAAPLILVAWLYFRPRESNEA